MKQSLDYGVVSAIRATDHDCTTPGPAWRTFDNKPLIQGYWYAVILTRGRPYPERPDFEQTIWTFLSGPCESEEEALSSAASVA
jgi:hypothetical protein